MSVLTKSVSGKCLCGACQFTAMPVEMTTRVCHCEACRRWAGVQFSVDCGKSLRLVEGSPISVYASSDHMDRVSCSVCSSPLYWVSKPNGAYFAVLHALNNVNDYEFTLQLFTDEKPSLYSFANDTEAMTGAEFNAWIAENGQAEG